jgi:tRNA 2-thiouridine synthesizing protein A
MPTRLIAMPTRTTLDCRRLLCPMPVIRVQDKVQTLAPGDELEALCTDPGVMNDIPAWCRINGHLVLDTRSDDGEYRILIRVGEAD